MISIGSPKLFAIVVSRLQLEHPLGRAGQAQAADLVPVDGLTGLRLEPAVQLDRVFEHACRVARRAQLADEPRGVPRGALGQAVLLEQHDVGLAHRRQVVGDAATEDAAADDHDSSLLGYRLVDAHEWRR